MSNNKIEPHDSSGNENTNNSEGQDNQSVEDGPKNPKTVATEIAAALGCSGMQLVDKSGNLSDPLLVTGVLPGSAKMYNEYCTAALISSDKKAIKILRAVNESGLSIFNAIKGQASSVQEVIWTGPEKMKVGGAAKDLKISLGAAQIQASVKAESNVIWNGSCHVFIDEIWRGLKPANGKSRTNWFSLVAPAEFNSFFLACNGPVQTKLPNIDAFNTTATRAERKTFSVYCANLLKNDANARAVYRLFCDKVSTQSAAKINATIESHKKANPKRSLAQLFTQPMWDIFRLNTMKYYLCGTDGKGNQPFAVEMPEKNDWSNLFELTNLEAIAQPAGQPEVLVTFTFKDKKKNSSFVLSVKYEIRWGHGKFNGSPEAKIYKNFFYCDLPWAKVLCAPKQKIAKAKKALNPAMTTDKSKTTTTKKTRRVGNALKS